MSSETAKIPHFFVWLDLLSVTLSARGRTANAETLLGALQSLRNLIGQKYLLSSGLEKMDQSLAEKLLEGITHFLEGLLRSLQLFGSATHEALVVLEHLLFDLLQHPTEELGTTLDHLACNLVVATDSEWHA